MKYFFSLFISLFIFNNCSTSQVLHEPNLDQISIQSETICIEFLFYSPFCTKEKSRSILIRGIYNNSTAEKKYLLDYIPDNSDVDIPVGVSINIDGTYYNLKKSSTDYVDILKVSSELTPEILTKIINSKNNFKISYSSRRDTYNYSLSDSNSSKLSKNANDVLTKIKNIEKLKIVN